MSENKKGFTTRMLTAPYVKKDPYNSLHMPVYETVAFEFDSAEDIAAAFQDKKPAHAYSRSTNPSVEYLESKIVAATGGRAALALSSGMAAIANSIFALVKPGENILSSSNLFGHTYGLFYKTLPGLGIDVRFTDLLDPASILKNIDNNTRLIFFETVTNPQLEVVNIDEIVKIAHKHDMLVIADSTLTPCNVFNARSFGIDVEIMSSTKFISGGATSVGGIIVDTGNNNWDSWPVLSAYYEKKKEMALITRLRKEVFRHIGSCMSPRTAQLQSMGLDILALRVERSYTNCMKLAEHLGDHPEVKKVTYPGLPGSEYYDLSAKQFNGVPGTILTFDLDSEEACFAFMNKLKVVRRATNMNDNKSLIIHPWSTIYFEYPESKRLEMGVRDTMLRLSVGIEDIEDLIQDIELALK
ncbi:aminotransferase class I/II-fold pyridoxal phosphate-dependent enzyme [Bacteroidota bacterium]